VHVPDGCAHHLRRPDEVPAQRGSRALEAQGPDRAGARVPEPACRRRARLLRRGRGRGRQDRRRAAGRLSVDAGSGADRLLRQCVRRADSGARRAEGPVRRVRRIVRRRGSLMTKITLGKGINMGLRAAMEADPKVVVMGEDIGKLGGVFRVTEGLQKDFGEARVIDTPLAESGIVGTAIGLALRGYRPVCEIQFDGFVFPAFNQIVGQLAKMRYRSRGLVALPVVIRIPFGGGIGAVEHHSESPEALFAHTAGLRVVACSNGPDAYTMIQQAVRSDDPVIFLEPKRRYWEKAEVDTAASLDEALPMDVARTVADGTDVTVLAYGPMVKVALDAAAAAAQDGRSVEVIDLRSLSPVDMAAIAA